MAARRRSINLKIRRFSWIGFHLRRGWISGFFFLLVGGGGVVIVVRGGRDRARDREPQAR